MPASRILAALGAPRAGLLAALLSALFLSACDQAEEARTDTIRNAEYGISFSIAEPYSRATHDTGGVYRYVLNPLDDLGIATWEVEMQKTSANGLPDSLDSRAIEALEDLFSATHGSVQVETRNRPNLGTTVRLTGVSDLKVEVEGKTVEGSFYHEVHVFQKGGIRYGAALLTLASDRTRDAKAFDAFLATIRLD